MRSYGLQPDAVLVLGLAALAAANLAAVLVAGSKLSEIFASLTAILAIVVAVQAISREGVEKDAADYFQGQADSYWRMLNDYFLVSKVDASGRFFEANENLLRRTGYSLEELASQPLGGLSSGLYSDDYLYSMWSTVQSGQTWTGEFCDRAKDGSLIWVRAIVIPERNARGEVKSLTTIGVDVTEQRSAEAKLKRAHATVESFIKHAPAAVAMFDTEMRYVAHTARWLQDYNLKQTSLVGLCHYDVFPEVPPQWKAKHKRISPARPSRARRSGSNAPTAPRTLSAGRFVLVHAGQQCRRYHYADRGDHRA